MSFGEKLTKLRKENHMSQEELAGELNVSRQAVSKWESNGAYPETKQIVAICKLFNCSMDELIGVKQTKEKSNKSIFKKLDGIFDTFIQGVKLFFNMTFAQKCKCIIEIGVLAIMLLIIYFITDACLLYVLEKILYIIPMELLLVLLEMLDGIYTLAFMLFALYSLIKLYKIRFLDCYNAYNKELKEDRKDQNIQDIKIKEEKIIIRDKKSSVSTLEIVYNICIVILKIFAAILVVFFLLAFIFILAFIVLLIYYAGYSLIIVCLAILLFGFLILIYILLELLIKYLFSIKQKLKHLYIMLIASLLIIGIGGGLFAIEVMKVEKVDEILPFTEVYSETFVMQDNLIIFKDGYTEFIFEDREDIQIVVYTNIDYVNVSTEKYEESYCYDEDCKLYYLLTTNYYDDSNFMEQFKDFLNNLKNYKIRNISGADIYRKVYISEENYEIIQKNINSYINYF